MFVTDTSARETAGVLATMTPQELTLVVDGQVRAIPMTDVARVAKRGDSMRNGFLIGFAAGAVPVGGLIIGGCYNTGNQDCEITGLLLGTLFGLETGAVGALIDFLIPGRTVIYTAAPIRTVAVRPIIDGRTKGVAVSLRFR